MTFSREKRCVGGLAAKVTHTVYFGFVANYRTNEGQRIGQFFGCARKKKKEKKKRKTSTAERCSLS